MIANADVLDLGRGDWQQRLAIIVEMMREMSRQTDPQEMVRAYGRRIRRVLPADLSMSLSRRDLAPPKYRITRCSLWEEPINPWKEKDRLPVLEGGLLGELIYGNEPRIIEDLHVVPEDPAAEFLAGQRTLMALPLYDHGVALNMVVLARKQPHAFPPDQFPELVWLSNLFGRATHNLVLSEQLQQAYDIVDREMRLVADIQRSLLPARLPEIPAMSLAAHYQTSSRAGGDYYDFLPLGDGRWGILIADVSGHGTPAAVLMAVTHSIVHLYPASPDAPGNVLEFLNRHLAARYTADNGKFVTAFYGVYDPAGRRLTYASAGHHPPRLKRCGRGGIVSLDGAGGLPLGVSPGAAYGTHTHALEPGDQLVFYTDGITDARNPAGQMFGTARLDEALERCRADADELIAAVLAALEQFTAGRAADDDRTLLVAKIC